LRDDVVFRIPYLKSVGRIFWVAPIVSIYGRREMSLEINFGGRLVLVTCWLHPVSSEANVWLCSTWSALVHVLLSNVVG